jgi:cytochrome P450
MPDDVVFDPFDHVAMEDPYGVYAELRSREPVYRNAERGFWALSRYEDVQAAARDWRTFSSARGVNLDDTHELSGGGNFIAADPPPHDVLRRLVREPFTPAGIRARSEEVRTVVATAVADFETSGGGDAAQELAWRIPVTVICRLLGLSDADVPAVTDLLHGVIARSDSSGHMPAIAVDAAAELRERVSRVVTAAGEPAGPVGVAMREAYARQRLDLDGLAGMGLLLLVAGTETVADFVGNALLALDRHPNQAALMASDPERVPAGVEELLRFESPVQHQARTLERQMELHGVTIPAGGRVLLLWGAANRDERRWTNPDELDLTREQRRHLAFGDGIHHCLGAPLARLETSELLRELFRRRLRCEVSGPVRFVETHNTRGLASLPVNVSAAA